LFLRYQSTQERAFHKALNTLLRLQKERRKNPAGFVSQFVENFTDSLTENPTGGAEPLDQEAA